MATDRNAFREAAFAVDRVRYGTMLIKAVLGRTPFPWQAIFLASRFPYKVLNCARQAGKSTITAVIPTHTAKYVPRSSTFVLADTEDNAVRDMKKIKAFMAADPTYPRLLRQSDSLVELDNGSSVEVLCATEKSARGPSKPRVVIVDEASRVEDEPITGGVTPMLTDNDDCELIVPSTPNGRSGYFFRAFNSKAWERYYVRSPFTPTSSTSLGTLLTEEQFMRQQAEKGIIGAYSPRHMNLDHQLNVQLLTLGQRLYRQEHCGEFVEPENQAFSYEDIERALNRPDASDSLVAPLRVEDIEGLAE